MDGLRTMTKPLICIVLVLFLRNATGLKRKFHRLIAAGLVFGLAGDVFLMMNNMFIFGLGSFLIGHILYAWAFLTQTSSLSLTKHKGYIFIACLLISYSYYLYSVLKPSLGVLEIPVIAYILVIAAMALFAFTRKQQTNLASFLFVFIGSLFFIASDSILAINKFVAYVPDSGIMIMSSYMLAQYGITTGAVMDRSNRSS